MTSSSSSKDHPCVIHKLEHPDSLISRASSYVELQRYLLSYPPLRFRIYSCGSLDCYLQGPT